MKIAVKLNEDKSVQFVNNTSEEAALNQSKDKGWTLVESDPAFSIETEYLWTVRESDGKLVHISTGMTPDEENLKKSALLGDQVGKALAQAGAANDTANGAVESVAALGKLIAPLLATSQTSSNTTNGGTN